MLRVAERTLDDAVSPVISVVIPTQLDCPDLDFFIQSTHSALNGVVSFEIIVVRFESSEENLIVAAGSIPTAQFVELQGTPDTARAILLGLAHSRGNVIVVLDNPQAEPSVLLPPLTQPLLEDSSDIVICSDQNSSNSPGVPLWQRMSRRLAGMLAMPFVDVVDPTSGCFAARRYTFDEIDVENAGPQFIVALLATQCESVRVQEIPVEISTPGHDTPRENVRFAANYLRQLARLSGAVASSGSAIRFGIVGLLGVGVDLSIFMLLSSFGLSIGASHIASFFAATIFNYILNDIWSFKRPQSTPQSKLTFTRYGAYLLICVAALFVRGGVLASGLEFGLPATLSVVIAIAFATGINFLGSMLFVFAQTERVKASIRLRLAAVAIIGYSFVLRIAYVVAIDLLPEEAYYWNYAKHLDIGYLDHPPMIAWLIGLSTFLFGDTEFAVRLPAFACWLITLGFICALTNRIVGRSAAFAAGAVIATFPFFFLSGFIATPDSPLMACWAASIYFLYSALNDQRRSAWIGFGIAVGLGLLSKYTIALIGPVALILMLLNKDARRWFRDPFPYIAAILALVLFSPVIVWNANHEWISFAFQSVRRLAQTTQFGLP